MSESGYNTGAVRELHSDVAEQTRSVEYHFDNGVSGQLTLLSGSTLEEGEIYLLTGPEQNKRIEILNSSMRHGENAEYLFRVV